MKQAIVFLIILTALFGCSKDKTTQTPTATVDTIPAITSSGINTYFVTDSVVIANVYARAFYSYYKNIKTSSDSAYGFIYLHNGKIINLLGRMGYLDIPQPVNPDLTSLTFEWYYSTSDSNTNGLALSDTSTTVDSTLTIFTWWYNDNRYLSKTKY